MEYIQKLLCIKDETTMTIRHLQIFSEVCRLESITKAADHMNMAQPAVSNAVRELESFYQVKLFERMNRRLYITNAGKCLLDYANSILAQFDEAREILQDIAAATPVRVGSNISFGTSYLPGLLSDFERVYPEIPVHTVIQNSGSIEERLQHNELDFAVVDNLKVSPYFCSKALVTEELSAVCSPEFPYLTTMMKAPQGNIRKGKCSGRRSFHCGILKGFPCFCGRVGAVRGMCWTHSSDMRE